MATILRPENVSLNGGSRERRMEGYKFSTNWLQSEAPMADDDRQSRPQAVGVRGWRLHLRFLTSVCQLVAAASCRKNMGGHPISESLL